MFDRNPVILSDPQGMGLLGLIDRDPDLIKHASSLACRVTAKARTTKKCNRATTEAVPKPVGLDSGDNIQRQSFHEVLQCPVREHRERRYIELLRPRRRSKSRRLRVRGEVTRIDLTYEAL
ncbi:MAG TPA: hypothetical protein VN428_12510 [Bryobacteraceae bacterium]|nr:hypothetical protein [Bryobacteraceae bacterium]